MYVVWYKTSILYKNFVDINMDSCANQNDMSIEHKLQRLKAEYKIERQNTHLKDMEMLKYYHAQIVANIIREISKGKLRNGQFVSFKMRMDGKRQFEDLSEINDILKKQNIHATSVYVHNTLLQNCISNITCCFCCPCIFFTKQAHDAIRGTKYEIVVCIDVTRPE